jgi:hypothetical protein
LNAHDRDSQLLISRDSETRHIIPAPDALRGGSIILAVRFELGCRRRRNFLPITRTSTENHVMSTIRNKDPTQMIGEVPPDAETDTNCGALSIEVFDGIRASVLVDRSQFSKDLTVPFSGAHRPLRNLQSMRDEFRVYRLQPGFKNVFDCGRLFRDRLQRGSEEGRHADPDLSGDDNQVVPIGALAHASAKLHRPRRPEGLPWCAMTWPNASRPA